jgi:hypothetical protein
MPFKTFSQWTTNSLVLDLNKFEKENAHRFVILNVGYTSSHNVDADRTLQTAYIWYREKTAKEMSDDRKGAFDDLGIYPTK